MIVLKSKYESAVESARVLAGSLSAMTKRAVDAEFQATMSKNDAKAWRQAAEERWAWLERMKEALEAAADGNTQCAKDLLAEYTKPVRIDWSM